MKCSPPHDPSGYFVLTHPVESGVPTCTGGLWRRTSSPARGLTKTRMVWKPTGSSRETAQKPGELEQQLGDRYLLANRRCHREVRRHKPAWQSRWTRCEKLSARRRRRSDKVWLGEMLTGYTDAHCHRVGTRASGSAAGFVDARPPRRYSDAPTAQALTHRERRAVATAVVIFAAAFAFSFGAAVARGVATDGLWPALRSSALPPGAA